MLRYSTLGLFIFLSIYAHAQYNTLYQHYYTPISGQALTVLDEDNVQFDQAGNIYTLFDRESIRYSILTCNDGSGGVSWMDTLRLPTYNQSANANFRIAGNRMYTIATYGNNLNSSTAEAVAITKYTLTGAVLNQIVLSNTGRNFRAKEIYVQPNSSIVATYLTNDAMLNWTVHVHCYDSNLNQKWHKTFPWPSYSTSTIPGVGDALSSFYLSYTIDSIAGGNYYRKAFVHKMDSSGNMVWTKNTYDKRYKKLGIDNTGNLVMAGETIAPLVIISNTIGDVLVTKWQSSNGSPLWETIYNSTLNEKEVLYDMNMDQSGNIILGGNQDIQDIGPAHYKGFANIYTSNGVLITNIIKPLLEVVYGTRYLSNGSAVVRSATATDMHLSEYTSSGIFIQAKSMNFINGASWSGMDIHSNDDIALAVSDVLCADRGVTTMKLSKKFPTSISNISSTQKLYVYPNPCTNTLHIAGDVTIEDASMFNTIGQKVNGSRVEKNTFDVATLPIGVYFLILQTNIGKQYIKFEKN